MNNQTGENKSRIIDVTKEHLGEGFQILSANKPKTNETEDARKINSNIPVRKEVIVGFIFRIFITVFLLLFGIKAIVLEKIQWPFRILGVVFIFLSIYLFYNLITKKTSKETYIYWWLGFIFTLVAIVLGVLNWRDLISLISVAFR